MKPDISWLWTSYDCFFYYLLASTNVHQVEVNPALSGDGPESIGPKETIRAGCSLVRCALGESLL